MKDYVYPAVIYPDSEGRGYTISLPDVNIVTEGVTVEDAFLRAKDFLSNYIEVCGVLDAEIDDATPFVDTVKKNPKHVIILVNTPAQ